MRIRIELDADGGRILEIEGLREPHGRLDQPLEIQLLEVVRAIEAEVVVELRVVGGLEELQRLAGDRDALDVQELRGV